MTLSALLRRLRTRPRSRVDHAGASHKLEYTTLATAFVRSRFTMAELRHVYEVVWGRPLDPGNFHRKIVGSAGFVRRTEGQRSSGRGRPAATFETGDAVLLNPPILKRVVP